MSIRTVLIAGAGGVLGAAVARDFAAAGYAVVGVTRKSSSSRSHDRAFTRMHYCDLCDLSAMREVVNAVMAEQGSMNVLVYNAVQLVMAPFMELTHADFENTWRASVGGAIACAQAVLPNMLNCRQGAMIFSGATGSLRGTSRFAAFSSAKFALRGLTQSLAREYQSQGIHVAHVIIDGLLRGSTSVAKFGGCEENTVDPAVVASTYRWLAEQPSSAWTLELDIRPNTERF
ncbi:MAG: SDR family NAD(P)-dependent oxidoreductase [Steroidobacter sp.]